MRLGFLGLGIMGAPMALNLLEGGHEVVVWNRTALACEPLRAAGAEVLLTPYAVTSACEITFAMLADPAAALAVACGPDGACEGLGAGRSYVDMSTVDASTSRQIEKAVRAQGGRFLEAPVSGTRAPAEQGTLIILAAGDESLFEEMAGPFDLMGKMTVFAGEVGQGARLKLVVNMVMGGMMAAFCEGLNLARKSGLETAELLAVLDAGALSNPMFRGKGPRMVEGDFATAFPLKHMQKDMRLALKLGRELEVALDTAAAANDSFVNALNAGDGDLDFSALLRTIER
ncbi:MAG: NAD(P)-dependent oxidoreductase [Candidatus Krumholzibacteria bacterium]|nr:NAD(P)-dependent oxidoreductase [Candidatus Krumholzibacteria bacterium]